MSGRALEFIETWVSEKIDAMEEFPADGDDKVAQALAAECIAAAQGNGIPQSEIDDAFDDLAAFINGQIEEAVERETTPDDDETSKDDALPPGG
jgi:hypothetical protein